MEYKEVTEAITGCAYRVYHKVSYEFENVGEFVADRTDP